MSTPAEPRRPRADAAANRDRLVAAAREAYAGATGPVSLEAVARAAGVGIGTLYRHFPTREALVEAVYRSELAAVEAEADALLDRHDARTGLRRWTDGYGRFVAAKRGMGEVLRAAWADGTLPASETRPRVRAVVARFLAAGAEDGTLRPDADPDDVTTALVGIFLATSGSEDPAQAGRLLDLLVDGLTPRA